VFCIECGKEIPNGVKFCPDCGAAQITKITEEKTKKNEIVKKTRLYSTSDIPELKKLTVSELKEKLKVRNLQTSGNKSELIRKLLRATNEKGPKSVKKAKKSSLKKTNVKKKKTNYSGARNWTNNQTKNNNKNEEKQALLYGDIFAIIGFVTGLYMLILPGGGIFGFICFTLVGLLFRWIFHDSVSHKKEINNHKNTNYEHKCNMCSNVWYSSGKDELGFGASTGGMGVGWLMESAQKGQWATIDLDDVQREHIKANLAQQTYSHLFRCPKCKSSNFKRRLI
tara:strand:- start:154 stop:999 length:846 start_codon:yes stop_codon:yes gene_type:complete